MRHIGTRAGAVLPHRGILAAFLAGVVAAVAWMPLAEAGSDPCGYTSDPEDSQLRGSDVRVSGTFGNQHQNGAITVFLRSAGDVEYDLNPPGTTDATGAFDHTVTIPADVPIGDYDLIVQGPSPGGVPLICSKPFTVTQFVIYMPPGGFTTPTPPPTTTATTTTTTTTPPTTTTTTTSPAETTTTSTESEEPTTTVAEETTTTSDADDESLVAGESVDGGGVSTPLVVLVIAMALTIVGLGGYAFSKRGTVKAHWDLKVNKKV